MKRSKFTPILALAIIAALIIVWLPWTSAQARSLNAGPMSSVWYFAEGRVGGGFLQWLTVSNPGSSSCAVNAKLLYTMDGSSTGKTMTVSYTVNPGTRYTESVNADLGIAQNDSKAATLSAIVSVDASTPTCAGVVVERPMYFAGFHSISSGTDVLGVSHLATSFYFADIPTGSAGESFLSILNPSDISANVQVTYYAGGTAVASDTLNVLPMSRGTFAPNNHRMAAHVTAVVTSDRPILVERPSYYPSVYSVSGSADVNGAQATGSDWLFADGFTGASTQENITIANFGNTDATASITLKSLTGATKAFPVTIPANSSLIWDVTANNAFTGATPEVAAEVNSSASTLVAQREMFTNYAGHDFTSHGITDTLGASSAQSAYSFAEGFVSQGFDEWLMIQNPSSATENITVTLTNMLGHSYTETITVAAQSRYTLNITALVANNLALSGEDARAYAVSMSITGTAFVAERTMYWNAFGTTGAESVVGYSG